jgi:hypothetical protein
MKGKRLEQSGRFFICKFWAFSPRRTGFPLQVLTTKQQFSKDPKELPLVAFCA